MSDATTIDVTNQAPKGRVVGQLPPCPAWCQGHDWMGSDQSFRLMHTGQLKPVAVTSEFGDEELTVALKSIDVGDHGGTVRREVSSRIVVCADGSVELDLDQASELAARIGEAVDLAEAELMAELDRAGGNPA